jgi:tetrathionate reductase subunit B
MKPVCVEACPSGALVFGDLADPESDISKAMARVPVTTLRPELGTQPQVYYIGMDERALDHVEGLE